MRPFACHLSWVLFVFAVGCGGRDAPKKVILCGNGELDSGEICDSGIDPGLEGACPTECADSGDACSPLVLEGFPGRCNVQCVPAEVPECGAADSCCPGGCSEDLDEDCLAEALCGNGRIDPGETCDPAIPGDCDCGGAPPNGCSQVTQSGDPSQCNVRCSAGRVTTCTSGDGCCPDGCTPSEDDDCSNVCGDGITGPGESCDGDCPTSCDDGNACTVDALSGSAAACNAVCRNEPVTSCVNGDGCCAPSCSAANDSDCAATCGNGIREGAETCDGNCPSTCDDGNACTTDTRSGSSAQCNVSCSSAVVRACVSGDGCCPAGCSWPADTDCTCVPDSCTTLGWECGTLADNGCGASENCGQCGADETCVNNMCEPTYRLGDACTSDSQCAPGVGLCLTQAQSGWTAGYCTLQCASDADCGVDGHCGSSDFCLASCGSNSDCRVNYECFDVDFDLVSECAPVGNGTGRPGSPCASVSECTGGQDAYCVTRASADFNDGYCLELCSADFECPGGSHCSPAGYCVDSCASVMECRTPGYDCVDHDGDMRLECFRSATGGGPVGNACANYWDCGGGLYGACATAGWPGGYCTISCDVGEGTCPTDSACLVGANEAYCVDSCQNNNQCRAGYTCSDPGDGTSACIP